MVNFLCYASLAIAMHHNDERESAASNHSELIRYSQAVVTCEDFADLVPADAIESIKSLEILDSKIEAELLKGVPEGLKGLLLSSVMDLDGNISSIFDCLTDIACLHNLEMLSLKNQYIGDAQVSAIAEMRGLKSLNLSSNQITGEGFMKIVRMQGLEDLDLSRNQIEGSQIKLLHFFKISIDNAKTLDAEEDQISEIPKITNLNLSFNQMGDFGAAQISTMHQVINLDLALNQIGDTGVYYISQMQGIKSLNLSANHMGDAGASYIAQMQGITRLNLSSNHMGADAVGCIAQMQGMKHLDLSLHQIGDAGVAPITKM